MVRIKTSYLQIEKPSLRVTRKGSLQRTRLFNLRSVAWLTIALFLTAQKPGAADAPITRPLDFAPPGQSQRSPTPQPLNFNPPTPQKLAQAQGSQISLNGRTFNLPWTQWQTGTTTRIGLSDAALNQLFGANLLSTSDVMRQPIEWFPTAQGSILSTRLAAPLRYLDITTLAQQYGWQMQASGQSLRINTPTAKLVGIRQGQQPFGDRIVIDLDRPVPWQVDQQSQEFILTLDAQTDPAFVQAFKPKVTTQVKSLKVEAGSNQTTIRLGIPITQRSQISTLSNPSRIVIDLRSDYLPNLNILWSSGLRWRQQTLTVGSSRFPVIWLEVNPRQPGMKIRPILPNPTVVGTAPLIQTARQSQASAAINGGFFNRNNQLPLGAIRLDGQWLSGPILNRGVFAWNETGETRFDRLTLQETIVASNQRIPLATLNSAYPQAGISRYTAVWGASYTTLGDNEILITVQNNQVTNQQPGGKAGSAFAIPTNGYLLVARSSANAAALLTIGTSLQLENISLPSDLSSYQNIVGAGPLLIQNRQIVLDGRLEKFSEAFIQETAARSAIGQTSDGTLLIVSVHNRVGGRGATLSETAQMMSQLGAVNALNLDGGSSTTLYLGGQILDRPPRSSARVHNAIGVFLPATP
ncbi:phosphodiester glycosidase family protein [Phormidesmis sp. 146-35]